MILARGNNAAAAAAAAAASKEEMLRASKDLTLGLEPSSSSFSSIQRPNLQHHSNHNRAAYPFELDLWPRSSQQQSAVSPHFSPSRIDRIFNKNNSNSCNNDCQEIPAPETHSSSRGGSPCGRGIDMNEIPPSDGGDAITHQQAANSSPRSSMSPSPFAFEISRKGESSMSIKRERETRTSDAEADRTCEVSSRGSDEEDGAPRKKLRLTKEQSALLEESFKEHSTLNPKQKTALAKELNLRPRQVEVWFQNRRARTKLKQTEIDCEVLRRVCETLTEDNRRLLKEVQELRAIKAPPPCVISQDFYMPLPAATLTMCPSCERVATVDGRSAMPFPGKAQHNFAAAAAAHHHHHMAAPPQSAAACRS